MASRKTRRVLNTKAEVTNDAWNRRGGSGGSQGSPSVLARVMDILSRGNYAMANAVHQEHLADNGKAGTFNPGAFAKGFVGGLTGKNKTTFSDVLADKGMGKSIGRSGLGFVMDVALDPTTYLTFGTGTVAKQGAKGAAKAVGKKAAERGTLEKVAAKVVQEGEKIATVGAKADRPIAEKVMAQVVKDAAGNPTVGATLARTAATSVDEAAPFLYHGADEAADVAIDAQKALNPARQAELAALAAQRARAGVDDVLELGADTPVGKGLAKRVGDAVSDKFWIPGRGFPRGGGAAANALRAGVSGGDEAADIAQALARAAEATQTAGRAGKTGAATGGRAAGSALDDPLTRRVLELRFAGKPIARSESAYRALQGAKGAAGATKAGQLIGETFNVGHGLNPEVANLQRIYSGRGRQAVDEFAREAHDVFKGISKEDQKVIRTAIQEDAVDTLAPELRDAAVWTQSKLDELNSIRTGSKRGGKLSDAKFEDIFPYKGASTPYERAPQNLIAQYDRVLRKQSYEDFVGEVSRRFPDNKEITDALRRSKEIFGVDGEVSAKWQHYMNAVQAPWKRWVTSYRPGFHIRNILGDSFNAYLAGTRPVFFERAGKVLAHESEDTIIRLGDKPFTTAEINRLYRKGGLETSFIETEVVGGHDRGLAHAITNFGEKREKFVRLATFMDSMDKALKRGTPVDKAVEEASMRVRKYHFDYTALTPSERKLRTFIPFYTYTRKELPVLLEHTLATPGKMARVPKATNALSQMFGVEHDPNDPFPGIDEMMPEWLKNQNIIQMGDNQVMSPGLPADLISMFNPAEFARQTAESLTPILKAPYELSTGERIGGGKQTQSLARYLAAQGPYGTLARDSDAPISERLWNILTGLGIRTLR